MTEILFVIFAITVLLVLHTYVIYPLILALLPDKKLNLKKFSVADELPVIAVLVAAYNEEKVIREKIESVFRTNYPVSKLRVYVGSDASADNTEKIVEELSQKHAHLKLVRFGGRVGKISIINHLQSLGDEEILVMTDANVIFQEETLRELIAAFADERTGIVAANIVKVSQDNEGISFQEKKYLSIENRIKADESRAFGIIMGAEGGCYAIRNSLFSKVPLKFIVDDFYITMQVLLRGKLTLFNPDARCTEDVAADSAGEYRRKVRISSGNFQNLFFFRALLLKFWKPIGFCFWSHKVLRWLTPFFIILSLLTSLAITIMYPDFLFVFLTQFFLMLMPAFNFLVGFKNRILLFVSHFYLMNLALLQGFFKFVKGIDSSIWQPVKRNV